MREQITFDFAGSFSGAYRDIPVRAGESITDVSVSEGATVYRPGANTELGGFGLPDSFGVTDIEDGLRIVWHYQATDQRRTFTISYRFRGLAVAYDDVVDVNLRVWGEHWPVGVANLTAVMQLPRATELSPSYRVWGSPVWVRGVVARLPDRATLRAAQVPAHQFVEHRVLFPRSLLTSTAGAQVRPGNALGRIVAEQLASQRDYEQDQEKIDDAKEHPGRTILILLLLGLGPALGLMALVWLFYGREVRTGYDREYEQSPPIRHGAGARPVAREAGNSARLERVHGDALRSHSAGPLQGDAGHVRAFRLGRASPPGRLRPPCRARRRDGGDGAVRRARRRESSIPSSTPTESGSRSSARRSKATARRTASGSSRSRSR